MALLEFRRICGEEKTCAECGCCLRTGGYYVLRTSDGLVFCGTVDERINAERTKPKATGS